MDFTSALLAIMVLGIVQDTPIVCILLIRIYTCFYCDLGLNDMAQLWHMRPRQTNPGLRHRACSPHSRDMPFLSHYRSRTLRSQASSPISNASW